MFVLSNFRFSIAFICIALFFFIDSGITSVKSDTIEVTATVVLGTDNEKKSGKKSLVLFVNVCLRSLSGTTTTS